MNRRNFFAISPMFIGGLVLEGCASPMPAQPPISPQTTSISMPSIAFIIPNDPAVVVQSTGVEGLALSGQQWGGPTRREIIQYKFTGEQGVVERRTDNGVAGSGQKVRVTESISMEANAKRVEFAPYERAVYQQGLILPFPVPRFEPEDIKAFFLSSSLHAKFEINSDFNPESIYANFVRLLKTRAYKQGEHDPVSGKIYKQEFFMPLRGRDVPLVVEAYPYRNGSKAVIYCRIPAVETAPNTVDFGILVAEVREGLVRLVKA